MSADPTEEVVAGNLRLNLKTHQLFEDEREIGVSKREFDLIAALVRHPGEIFSTDRIWTEIWGEDPAADKKDKYMVHINVRWLRGKIETDPVELKRILTVHGAGYYFAG